MRSLRMKYGKRVTPLAVEVGIARHQLHYLESGYRRLRPENAALLLKAIGVQGWDLAWWGHLIETLVSKLSLEELQQLNRIDPRDVKAATS
jgi:hypothetical protein